ncbi:MAG: tripartite tricarboxylate transporter substrate binding protein [Burkholderiaceae bacterium]|nr:tripartite tricarboxylate transporter substrate binding protein [Burkholderiaceae bacterium]MDO9088614.1 tripartite tricarboxylate transporter substrate binding protein [Burkholderiaceae bacterium]
MERRQFLKKTGAGLAASVAAAATHPVLAQAGYPNKPIKLIIPWPAGGNTPDLIGRIAAQGISEQLNVPVIVDNKPGANGNIGSEFVAKSAPDGYTLLLNTSALILSPALYANPGYDPIRDFAPVTLVYTTPAVYAFAPSVPGDTIQEVMEYGRKNPGKIAYGSGGNGNITHLAAQLLFDRCGVKALHVPYKSGNQAINDIIAGQIHAYTGTAAQMIPFMKDKRIKVLGVASMKRLPSLPDVPTIHESVAPNFDVGFWGGLVAPAKTPPAVVSRLQSALGNYFGSAAGRARLDAQGGIIPIPTSSEEYGAYLKSELARWSGVIRQAGIKPE